MRDAIYGSNTEIQYPSQEQSTGLANRVTRPPGNAPSRLLLLMLRRRMLGGSTGRAPDSLLLDKSCMHAVSSHQQS